MPTWKKIVNALLVLWAVSGVGHIFIGLFDSYERMSGRADFHVTGGIAQIAIAAALLVFLNRR